MLSKHLSNIFLDRGLTGFRLQYPLEIDNVISISYNFAIGLPVPHVLQVPQN